MIACAIISVLVLAGFGVYIFRRKPQLHRHEQLLTPLQTGILAVFVAAAILFFGLYGFVETEEFPLACRAWWHNFPHALLLSLHTAIRLFVVDSNFEIVLEAADNSLDSGSWAHFLYVFYAALLYLAAPILTFSFVLSFFHDVRASFRYGLPWNRRRDAYIFSELSEKSLNLAESIAEKAEKHPLIVFTNVSKEDDVDSCLIQQRIKKLKALTFHKGMLHVGFRSHSKKSTIAFFVLGEKEPDNIRVGLELIKEYGDRPLTELYVLASSASAELMLNSANRVRPVQSERAPERITVRCINSVRSLIYQTLYDMELERLHQQQDASYPRRLPQDLFESALPREDTGVREISALVLGMGQHGQEMLKALSWFCQMDGYGVVLNAVDQDPEAESRFTALCPELMARSLLPQDSDGEARCVIRIHGGMNAFGSDFAALAESLPNVGYIFVALGDDDLNIRAALMLRMLYHRMDRKPIIQAIVFDPDKTDALHDISNFKGQAYAIDFIGDLRSQYSEKVIINSELETKALRLHTEMYGGSEEQFWTYEYNYRSSIAAVLHYYARKACGVPMECQPRVEHNRWNAYMRSEGYVYSGSRNPRVRSDLGKKHFSLVDFSLLDPDELAKDANIADLQKWLD